MKNSIIKFSALIVLVILFGCSSGVQSLQQDEKPAKNDYYVAAYIWPSCHDDSLGTEKLWPEGTGEWEVIKKGNPRFEGHFQPRQRRGNWITIRKQKMD
jgi:hypothetical protein